MPTAPVICITTMISFLYSRIETGAVIRKTLSVQLFPGCLATNFLPEQTGKQLI